MCVCVCVLNRERERESARACPHERLDGFFFLMADEQDYEEWRTILDAAIVEENQAWNAPF